MTGRGKLLKTTGGVTTVILSCLGDYVSVTVWYDETVVVVGLAVKLAV